MISPVGSMLNSIGQLGSALAQMPRSQSADRYLNLIQVGLGQHLLDGDRLVERIAFWRELGPIGLWRASKLADQLDRISDRIERLLPVGREG